MDSAIFGLIGVVLGAFLGVLRDWVFQRQKQKKEHEYLAVRVACELDRFVYRCVDVAQDDGTLYGQYDKDGYACAQSVLPVFSPFELDVEWRSLPSNLMYEILNFPNKIEVANECIAVTFDYAAMPPDYQEGFEMRQLSYAELGLLAMNLAEKLRRHSGLPSYEAPQEWSPSEIFHDKKQRITASRERRHSAATIIQQ